MRIRCPQCREWTTWEENPNRPFCSERCRLTDLGAWATEAYRIAGKQEEDEDGQESAEDDQ